MFAFHFRSMFWHFSRYLPFYCFFAKVTPTLLLRCLLFVWTFCVSDHYRLNQYKVEAWPTLSIADNSEDLKPPLDKTFSCSLIKIAHIEYQEHVWFALGLENGELTVLQTDAKTREVKTTLSHSLDGLSDLMFFPRSSLKLFFFLLACCKMP